MRKFDVFDVKASDAPKLKYEIRKLVNFALDDLELAYDMVMGEMVAMGSDSFFEFVSLLDKLYTIFDFMFSCSMINRFLYEEYMQLFFDMNVAVEDKVEHEEVVFESLSEN